MLSVTLDDAVIW